MDLDNGKYGIVTPKEQREFDAIVAAVPLTRLEGVLKGFVCPIRYSEDTRLAVRGKLKDAFEGYDTLINGEGSSGVVCIGHAGGDVYQVCADMENPRLGDFFRDGYEEAKKVVWKEALPIVGGVNQIPHVKVDKGLYFIGDFPLPSMEMPVSIGNKVSREILSG